MFCCRKCRHRDGHRQHGRGCDARHSTEQARARATAGVPCSAPSSVQPRWRSQWVAGDAALRALIELVSARFHLAPERFQAFARRVLLVFHEDRAGSDPSDAACARFLTSLLERPSGA